MSNDNYLFEDLIGGIINDAGIGNGNINTKSNKVVNKKRNNTINLIELIIEKDFDHSEPRISYMKFIKNAILKLRDMKKSNGIHSVYSGFNQAFRSYYNEDPVKVVNDLAEEGIVEIQMRKGGVMLYIAGESPNVNNNKAGKALEIILTDD